MSGSKGTFVECGDGLRMEYLMSRQMMFLFSFGFIWAERQGWWLGFCFVVPLGWWLRFGMQLVSYKGLFIIKILGFKIIKSIKPIH